MSLGATYSQLPVWEEEIFENKNTFTFSNSLLFAVWLNDRWPWANAAEGLRAVFCEPSALLLALNLPARVLSAIWQMVQRPWTGWHGVTWLPWNLFTASPTEGTRQEQVPISRLPWNNLTKTDTGLLPWRRAACSNEPGVRSLRSSPSSHFHLLCDFDHVTCPLQASARPGDGQGPFQLWHSTCLSWASWGRNLSLIFTIHSRPLSGKIKSHIFEYVSQNQCPLPVYKECRAKCHMCDLHMKENLKNPSPFADWTQPHVCWEFLVGLPLTGSHLLLRHWAVSVLWLQAVGRAEVDKRRWDHKGQFAKKALGSSWDSKSKHDSQGFPLDVTNSSRSQGWPT